MTLETHAITAVVSDLHGGNLVALTPEKVALDTGQELGWSRPQRWLWERWIEYWAEIGRVKQRTGYPVVAVVNGEIVDKNYHPNNETATKYDPTLMDIADDLMEPLYEVADYAIVTRGTEAHTDIGSALDELAARRMSNSVHVIRDRKGNYSWGTFWGRIGGVTMDIAHHPGHGYMREWTAGGDANRLAATQVYRYAKMGLPIPQLTLRGHNHKATDSADNHPNRAIITPSWQLEGAFGRRIGGGFLKTGGLYVLCEEGQYNVVKRYHDWPITMEDMWTPDLLPQSQESRNWSGRLKRILQPMSE